MLVLDIKICISNNYKSKNISHINPVKRTIENREHRAICTNPSNRGTEHNERIKTKPKEAKQKPTPQQQNR